MKLLSRQLHILKQQADAAPWLKWAALLTIVLLAGFALQALEGIRVERQKAAMDAEQNLRKVLALKGQDIWLTREKAANELQEALLNELPSASTPGLAQAALQGWLRETASTYDTNQNVRVNVNRAGNVESMPGVMRVNASFSGNLSPRESLGLLRRIETASNLMVVESISVQSDSSNVVQLTLNAYYRAAGDSAP